jgi:hypothetical protein
MGLGGLGVIAEGVVLARYEANIDQAKAKVKELSGEQKKAAKEAAEAYKAQGEAWKKHVGDFAKGAAAITAGYLVAKNGLQAMREEQRLLAGSAGVDIDGLSKAWGGLRTQVELMTFAQAGHQGAWKLTSAQLEQVTAGMRALEAKGNDSQKVFERFTEVLHKGKLEGLDEFGLSLKSTGNQSEDLTILMNALGREVLDVGGNFAKTGDAAQRSIVKMEDGLSRLRITAGKAANAFLDLGVAIGQGLGRLVYGDLPEDNGPGGKASAYAEKFRARRGFNVRSTFDRGRNSDESSLYSIFDNNFSGTDAAGQRLATFSSAVRQGMIGRGPLATASPEEFAKMVAGMPEDWQAIDPFLAKRVDELSVKLTDRFNTVGVDAAKGILHGFKNALDRNKRTTGGGRGRGSRRSASDDAPTFFDSIVDTGSAFGGFLQDTANANMAAAAAESQRFGDAQSAYRDQMSQRFADAQMVQDIEAGRTSLAQQQEQSFLERTFGKLEEFDKYAAGFATLKGAVTDGFAAWIEGSESVGAAVRKSVAQSLGAYAIEMAGMAVVSAANGVYHLLNPLTAAQGAGELWAAAKYGAAAGALGYMAKELGGGSKSSGVASSAAGVGGRGPSNDNRTSAVVIVGDPLGDDSPRERQRRTRRAMRAAGSDNTGVRNG